MLMGIMRAILGSHQRPADGCANLFQTNLSLTCRYLQLQVVWVYTCFFKASGMKVHRELDISPLPLL
ncbi:Uncharacterised protein [Vibrio cholerae]|uniref:Uncharacterized protein n=1 Tax=Vibrio cholerae TaxID=666 RepID=A0A655RMS3_VIBCL|nr:Uncharacterised protein [Vibrio cholerae]